MWGNSHSLSLSSEIKNKFTSIQNINNMGNREQISIALSMTIHWKFVAMIIRHLLSRDIFVFILFSVLLPSTSQYKTKCQQCNKNNFRPPRHPLYFQLTTQHNICCLFLCIHPPLHTLNMKCDWKNRHATACKVQVKTWNNAKRERACAFIRRS